MMAKYIRKFQEVSLGDVELVGGKNASLGEMIQSLANEGIRVPDGFVITSEGYSALLEHGGISESLRVLLQGLDKSNVAELSRRGKQARAMIRKTGLPDDLSLEICQAYKDLCEQYGDAADVAVRSSATAEDLPEASFAGQQESFLNISGETALLDACLNCFASLFTDRAIAYRLDQGFDHESVKLSVGVQKMVRSDLASSGVIFTIDPESGFRDIVLVTASYGLGENIVAGRVDPDEFVLFKPKLKEGYKSIIKRKIGSKQFKLVYAGHGTRTTANLETLPEERKKLCLSDEDAITLAEWSMKIEEHYSRRYGRCTAMDIEWAKDGLDGSIYIVQARPETIHQEEHAAVLDSYRLSSDGKLLLTGKAIGERIGAGNARQITSVRDLHKFKDGEVLIADMTDPDWEPIMKRASAIVTNRGGRTCHAAIVSREMGVPCVVGTGTATALIKDGQPITVSCAPAASGMVFDGVLEYSHEQIKVEQLPRTRTKIMLNLANPEQALALSFLPVEGVGLVRQEFVIANEIRIHPLALIKFDSLVDVSAKKEIELLTKNYATKTDFFVDKLAEGIATIAAAFYPREIIVRFSDFKTNEYANLIGGKQFEPKEENPMIGFRGASRYYSNEYREGFALECQAIRLVRESMGLDNVKVMVPFCRTPEEGQLVIEEMAKNGLIKGVNGLEVYVMCELPSNVVAADLFAEVFDGFSIGSNDLTQLVLGVDRDSEIVSHLFDERLEPVKRMITMAVKAAKRAGRKIGICGQAPSDYPEFARFLIELEIDSISLNEDAVVRTLIDVARHEKDAICAS
ncbi:MAG: phosphoenolpyruvate synthase [Candidatus Obscuribacterales bacterium]|nr:phosphoenolpyruvate synthase [Candidatus Obscuribacterales bacterium]